MSWRRLIGSVEIRGQLDCGLIVVPTCRVPTGARTLAVKDASESCLDWFALHLGRFPLTPFPVLCVYETVVVGVRVQASAKVASTTMGDLFDGPSRQRSLVSTVWARATVCGCVTWAPMEAR